VKSSIYLTSKLARWPRASCAPKNKRGGGGGRRDPYGNHDIEMIIRSFTVCFREKITPKDNDSNMATQFTCILTLCFISLGNETLRARHYHYLGSHHTRAKGRDFVIVSTLDSHPNALLLAWFVGICVRLTSSRWTWDKFQQIVKYYP
jgi:hypothetical protein